MLEKAEAKLSVVKAVRLDVCVACREALLEEERIKEARNAKGHD